VDNLKLLGRIVTLLKEPSFKKRLMEASSQKELFQIIAEEDEKILIHEHPLRTKIGTGSRAPFGTHPDGRRNGLKKKITHSQVQKMDWR